MKTITANHLLDLNNILKLYGGDIVLVGEQGCGKTRLIAQVSQNNQERIREMSPDTPLPKKLYKHALVVRYTAKGLRILTQ